MTTKSAPAPVSGPEAPLDCDRCPRLRAFLLEQQRERPTYFNAPVPSFGDEAARVLIIGLAPGMHGANQTGRPFTGDGAGVFLYRALEDHGFSRGTYAARPDDGLKLDGAMITNAVRCLPPGNKPTGLETTTCRPFLAERIRVMPTLKVLLCLGKVSHDSTVRALGLRLAEYKFGHATEYKLGDGLTLLSSYHCSRYNVNTNRLTYPMFSDVFARARELAEL